MNRPRASDPDQDLPQYDHPEKQEAVDFIARDLDVQPIIDGMEDLDRVDCWQQVVERFDDVDDVAEALRDRRAQLEDELDQQAEFERASDTNAGQQAVADGGADLVEEEPDVADGANKWAPREGQTVLQYGTDEEFEDELRTARDLAQNYETVDDVTDALDREEQRDEWRPHVAQALRERLEEVKQ